MCKVGVREWEKERNEAMKEDTKEYPEKSLKTCSSKESNVKCGKQSRHIIIARKESALIFPDLSSMYIICKRADYIHSYS